MWPMCLPPSEAQDLEITIKRTAQRIKAIPQHKPTHVDMVREAKKIGKAAIKLLEYVEYLEHTFPYTDNESVNSETDYFFKTLLNDNELAMARLGYSKSSLEFVLIGLNVRMRMLQKPGKPGRRVNPAQLIVNKVEDAFEKLGLPTGRADDFLQAVEHALKIAEIKSSTDSLIRSRKKP